MVVTSKGARAGSDNNKFRKEPEIDLWSASGEISRGHNTDVTSILPEKLERT